MKRTIKTTVLICCIAFGLFLLLPFVVPEGKAFSSQADNPLKPQIFSSNPLTPLMKRIAKFWGLDAASRRQQTARRQARSQAAQQRDMARRSGLQEREDVLAAAVGQTVQQTSQYQADNAFLDAMIQNENGEWVLIRQRAPEASNGGMHEINVRDSAYEQYVKQERAARFNPAAAGRRPGVPDSAMARLFRPIKQFFGFYDDNQTVEQADWVQGARDNDAAAGSRSDGLGKYTDKNARALPRAADINEAMRLPQFSGRFTAAPNLLALISPENALRESADLVADSADPNDPGTRGADRDQNRAKYMKQFVDKVQQKLVRDAAGAPLKDAMLETVNCPVRIRAIPHTSCEIVGDDTPAPEPAPAPSPDEQRRMQEQNRLHFLEKTNYPLPQTPLTVVLAKADPAQAIEEESFLPKGMSDGFDKTVEIYQYMLDHTDCSQGCYWVARTSTQDQDVRYIVEGTGLPFNSDPENKYTKIKRDFTNDKLAALPPDADEKTKKDARTQADKFDPPWVLYTTQDLATAQDKSRQRLAQHDMQHASPLFIGSSAAAHALQQDLKRPPVFFYDASGNVLKAEGEVPATLAERSAMLTDSLANQVNFMQNTIREIRQEAGRDAVVNTSSATIKKTQQQVQQEIQNYRNPYGSTQK